MDTIKGKGELIVHFGGGLGNQLFSYALYSLLKEQGKNVTADLSHYVQSRRSLLLNEVFKNCRIRECDYILKERYFSDGKYCYDEIINRHNEDTIYDPAVLDMTEGYIYGYFQTCRYAEMNDTTLRNKLIANEKLKDITDSLAERYIAPDDICVHVRRGDFLSEKNVKIYGGICTENYYMNALAGIRESNKTGKLFVFSDDYEWILENSSKYGFTYIDRNAIREYRDYFDLILMSKFRYQIISNSTFSWWGAWLCDNPEQIVAPCRWINIRNMDDIIPKEWRKAENVIC